MAFQQNLRMELTKVTSTYADFGRLQNFQNNSSDDNYFPSSQSNLPLTRGGHYQPLELEMVIKV